MNLFWADKLKYLGVYFDSGKMIKIDILPIMHKFYGSATHTHPFNSPFSGTTQVSRYQKDETSLDFTEARYSEWRWNPLSAPRSKQITMPAPHHSVFYRSDVLPAAQPTASKH